MRYYILTVPGIEATTNHELRNRFGPVENSLVAPGRIVFDRKGNAADLLCLGTAEDVFIVVAEAEISSGWGGLRQARELVRKSRRMSRSMNVHRDATGRHLRKHTFRVVAQKISGQHAYRRVDLQREVSKALQFALPRWKNVTDNAEMEFWVLQDRNTFLCGLRLSDRSMRHRAYKKASVVASLRPVVARAMVLISEPEAADVFLDPMCGAGTIIIERGLDSRYGYLLAGDLDDAAVGATRANIGPRYKPIKIARWDAERMPLSDSSVDKIVCNLPFGKKSGRTVDQPILYSGFVAEAERLLRPGGAAVILTNQDRLLAMILRERGFLSLELKQPIRILGMRASIFRIRRTARRRV